MKSITNILIFTLFLIFYSTSSQINTLSNKNNVIKLNDSTKKCDKIEQITKDETIKENNNINSEFSVSDIIAVISAILALIAIGISIVTAQKTHNLANKDFLLTHRPFVWAENFGYVNDQNIAIRTINQVIIVAQNSPAKLHREYFEYYTIDNLGVKTIIDKQEFSGQILYPIDKSQYVNTSGVITDQFIQTLTVNQELERIIRIDYSWLSAEKKYFFEGKWKFDKKSKTWKNVNQTAN